MIQEIQLKGRQTLESGLILVYTWTESRHCIDIYKSLSKNEHTGKQKSCYTPVLTISLGLLSVWQTMYSVHAYFCQVLLHIYIKCEIRYLLKKKKKDKLHVGNSQFTSFVKRVDIQISYMASLLLLLSTRILSHLFLWTDHSTHIWYFYYCY